MGLLLRGGASTRFHPNRRASTDHKPGPNIATAALMVASSSQTHLSPGSVRIFHSSTRATIVPAMGVHKPRIKRIAPARRITEAIVRVSGGSLHSLKLARTTSTEPRTSRRMSNPMPGEPPANVEYRRRKTHLSKPSYSQISRRRAETPERGLTVTLSSLIAFGKRRQAADHRSMRSIVGA